MTRFVTPGLDSGTTALAISTGDKPGRTILRTVARAFADARSCGWARSTRLVGSGPERLGGVTLEHDDPVS